MPRAIGRPSAIEFFKKQAKQWLKALRAGDAAARERLERALPQQARELTLRTVQQAIAREHGFASWDALLSSPAAEPAALKEAAYEILRHAIFRGDHTLAAQLFAQTPGIAAVDVYAAVAAGDYGEVERRLAADPSAAARSGGPLDWPPLLYLAYMRLPGGAARSVEIARALLDRGADPNASWNDGWDNPFTVLTGVIALGEGVKPTHERADELVALLFERGAEPFDTQSFYNTSIVDDDTHWLEVLWAEAARRGNTDLWRAPHASHPRAKLAPTALDFMLGLAVSYGHMRRARWLLEHGADAGSRHSYSGRLQREEALVYGNAPMVELLEQHGARVLPVDDKVAFQVACRSVDRATARRLASLHPEFLEDAELMIAASRKGRLDIVELLLELGVDVDIEDSGATRALHVAVGNGALEIVQLLLARGADPDRPTKHYGGPLGFAAHFNQRAAAALLAPYSRDVHNMVFLGMQERLRELFAAEPALVNLAHFRSGQTPLFMLPADDAAALEMAQFMLEHGADAAFRGRDGRTPAQAARQRGLAGTAALLSRAQRTAGNGA